MAAVRVLVAAALALALALVVLRPRQRTGRRRRRSVAGNRRSKLAAALTCSPGFAKSKRRPGAADSRVLERHDCRTAGTTPAAEADRIPFCSISVPDEGYGDLQKTAEHVVFAVRRMSRVTGRKVTLLGHQHGGLDELWALTFWPDVARSVSDLVTLATPHAGTTSSGGLCAARRPLHRRAPPDHEGLALPRGAARRTAAQGRGDHVDLLEERRAHHSPARGQPPARNSPRAAPAGLPGTGGRPLRRAGRQRGLPAVPRRSLASRPGFGGPPPGQGLRAAVHAGGRPGDPVVHRRSSSPASSRATPPPTTASRRSRRTPDSAASS